MKSLKPTRRLFVDDQFITRIDNLNRVMHEVDKHPDNPVLRPDKPWEGRGFQLSNSAIYDANEGLFKLHYGCYRPDGHSVCLATSKDGVNWEKPALGLTEYHGSKDNNILPELSGQIIYGGDDFGDAPSGQMYRTIMWGGEEKGQCVAFSDDGIHWTPGPSIHVEGAGDVFVAVKSMQPLSGDDPGNLPGYPVWDGMPRYFGVARWCMPVGKFDGSSTMRPTRRVMALLESDDLIVWKNAVRILTPDGQDDEMAHPRIEAALADGSLVRDCMEDRRCEFYSMLVVPYEDMYIGLLMIFDPSYEFHRIDKNNQAGPCHNQLVASRDLIDWQRLGDRQPFIPRGGQFEFDWALANHVSTPIVKDGKLWIYYTGVTGTHAGTRDEANMESLNALMDAGKIPALSSIGLATIRRDGFVSLNAGDEPGYVLTTPISWPEGGSVHLNVDASAGEVTVGVVQPDGTPVPGYGKSLPLTGDLLDGTVIWQGKTDDGVRPLHTHGTVGEAPVGLRTEGNRLKPGDKVRLKISARNAQLYSYWLC